jgi:hypothetical protein
MKKETLLNQMYQHGRLTAYHNGERQVIWGVIAEVTDETATLLNHSREFQRFELKAIKGFRKEEFSHRKKYSQLLCDCGCKSEEKYICEVCGGAFCGAHIVTIRDSGGSSVDTCIKCLADNK